MNSDSSDNTASVMKEGQIMYKITYQNGHVVVLKDGKFWGSYDTKEEAYREILEEGLV